MGWYGYNSLTLGKKRAKEHFVLEESNALRPGSCSAITFLSCGFLLSTRFTGKYC